MRWALLLQEFTEHHPVESTELPDPLTCCPRPEAITDSEQDEKRLIPPEPNARQSVIPSLQQIGSPTDSLLQAIAEEARKQTGYSMTESVNSRS